MVLRFNLDIDIEAEKWDTPEEETVFICNFTEIVQKGLERMTVPDWTVKNVTAKEIKEE